MNSVIPAGRLIPFLRTIFSQLDFKHDFYDRTNLMIVMMVMVVGIHLGVEGEGVEQGLLMPEQGHVSG
jgi:hypothetical protein